eukprot:bmy_06691T0
MSNPEPPTETPGANAPTWLTQPTYSNLVWTRARQATTGRGQPVPLQSCPSSRWTPSWASPSAALEARQLEGLRAVYARLHARLLGGLPGPCRPGHRLRLLDSSPCVESWDALYYRLVRRNKEAWHLLAAKVSPASAPPPRRFPQCPVQGITQGSSDSGPIAYFATNLRTNTVSPWSRVSQGRRPCWPGISTSRSCVVWRPRAHFPRRPGAAPWRWRRRCRSSRWSSGLWRRARSRLRSSQGRGPAAPAALERREARAAAPAELRPENLLLAAPRGCSAARPQRLLLVDFGRGPPRPPGRPLREPLGPGAPLATSLAVGLEHLAAQLARARPPAAGTHGALQMLLWGPGPELRGHGAPLGSWLRMRHALLVLHLAERAVGGEVPSLEDWLCCEYLAKATEDSLYLALELLWN